MEKRSCGQPLVSIIIPVYNPVLELLDKAIDSCILQTYHKIEIIVIDDGGNGETSSFLDQYPKKDRRIRVSHIMHSGVSSARNTGISLSKGDYITFVDGDDEIDLHFIEDAVLLCEDNELEMVCGKLIYRYPSHERTDNWVVQSSPLILTGNELTDLSEFFVACRKRVDTRVPSELFRGVGAKLIKKSIITHQYDEGLDNGEDILFNSLCVKNASKVGIADMCWYVYNQHPSSAVHSQPISVNRCIGHCETIREYVKNGAISSRAFYAHCVRYLQATVQRNIDKGLLSCRSVLLELLKTDTFAEAYHSFDSSLYENTMKDVIQLFLYKKRMVTAVVVLTYLVSLRKGSILKLVG